MSNMTWADVGKHQYYELSRGHCARPSAFHLCSFFSLQGMAASSSALLTTDPLMEDGKDRCKHACSEREKESPRVRGNMNLRGLMQS